MAELLYKSASPNGEAPGAGASDGAAAGAGANGNGQAPSEDVIDAEFKEAK